jgi:hypothetical protein
MMYEVEATATTSDSRTQSLVCSSSLVRINDGFALHFGPSLMRMNDGSARAKEAVKRVASILQFVDQSIFRPKAIVHTDSAAEHADDDDKTEIGNVQR